MNTLSELFSEYGCYIDKFTNINNLTLLIKKFNKISNVDIRDLKYLSCKDDAGIFVLVTNEYVIKIYSLKGYSNVVIIYHRLLSNGYGFDNIETIYYYYSVIDGYVQHDTYPGTGMIIGDIHATVNELLIPIFYLERGIIITNMIWNNQSVKK